MRGAVLAAALAAGCAKTATLAVSADQVNAELVEAGCVSPGSSASIAAELQLVDAQDPVLQRSIACLFDGGTVASCGMVCSGKTR